MINKLTTILSFAALSLLTACVNKQSEGTLTYDLSYQLPDSLKSFATFLPRSATVYFKGDSSVTVQGSEEESTKMITHQPTNYLLGLFTSGPLRRFKVQFSKEEQQMELPDMSAFEFVKGSGKQTIAGFEAEKYIIKNKLTGDTTSAWFTHDLKAPANFLTMMFSSELGTPISFSINQNGMITTTRLKNSKFGPVPAEVFTAPKGYIKLTPQQFRDMPVEN